MREHSFSKAVLTLRLSIIVTFLHVSAATPQLMTDKEQAESVGLEWALAFASSDNKALLNDLSTGSFRKAVTPEQLVTELAFFAIRTGGPPSETLLVGSTAFSKYPDGREGDFYYVRVMMQNPNGPIYIDTYMSKIGLAWLVDSYQIMGAPPYSSKCPSKFSC